MPVEADDPVSSSKAIRVDNQLGGKREEVCQGDSRGRLGQELIRWTSGEGASESSDGWWGSHGKFQAVMGKGGTGVRGESWP